jgi:erythromycin esterase-like protein
MIGAGTNSWNLRDSHMIRVLEALVKHLERQRGKPTKAVVWVSCYFDHKLFFLRS